MNTCLKKKDRLLNDKLVLQLKCWDFNNRMTASLFFQSLYDANQDKCKKQKKNNKKPNSALSTSF